MDGMVPGPRAEGAAASGQPGRGALLTVDVIEDAAAAMVYVRGEVDMATAPILRARLTTACAASPVVLVDMSETTFFGSTGLALVLDAQRHCHRRGGTLRLVRPSDTVLRTVRITGLEDVLLYGPSGADQSGATESTSTRI